MWFIISHLLEALFQRFKCSSLYMQFIGIDQVKAGKPPKAIHYQHKARCPTYNPEPGCGALLGGQFGAG